MTLLCMSAFERTLKQLPVPYRIVSYTGVWTAQQGGRPDVTVLPLVSRECYIPECEQPSRAARRDGVPLGES